MRTNPFLDAWLFLIGSTDDHRALGPLRYLFIALFLALLVTSAWIALKNWREEHGWRKNDGLGSYGYVLRCIPWDG
jgi:hypothetical protein